MFKKVGVGALVAVVLVFGLVSAVLAQGPNPSATGSCALAGSCGGYGMGGFGYRGTLPSLVAEELGLTVDELFAALADGSTVADVAAQQGVELADLVEAVIAPRIELLDQAVADGRLSQEQADLMLDEMREHLTDRLEAAGLGGQGYGHGECGMMGGGSFGQPGGLGSGHWGGMHGGRWGGGMTGPRFPSNAAPSGGL